MAGRNGAGGQRDWVARAAALGALLASASALAVVAATSLAGGAPAADAAQDDGGGTGGARASAGRRRTLTVAWGGDTVLGSSRGLPAQRGWPVLAPVAGVLRRADLTAVNYEGTLATGGASKCLGTGTSQCFAFRAPPENAAALRRAGVDLVNLANNHAHDFGPAGMHETAQALRRHGIGVTGRPSEVLLTRSRGVRVAVVGFSTYPWSASMRDLAAVRALVRQAAARADVVIALMHAGAEGVGRERTPLAGESYLGEDRGDVRAFAHTAVHAGADLVLGSGPHVLRGLELYRGRVVAYSLGNLAGYHTFSSRGTMSLSGVLRVTLDPRGRYPGGRFTSLVLDPASIPRVDRRQAAGRLVSQLGRADFGSRALVVDAAGRIRALRSEPPPAGAQDPRT